MDQNIKQRLVGIAVIFALAVIFLPMVLDGSGVEKKTLVVEIPDQPVVDASPNPEFDQKIIELQARVDELPDLEPRYIDEGSGDKPNTIKREPEKQAEAVEVKPDPEPESESKKQTVAKIEKAAEPKAVIKTQAGGDTWVLQVGSFKDKEKAMAQRDRLRKSKIAAVFVEKFDNNNQASYRVRLGPFLNRDQSKVAQNKIRAKYNIDGLIMKYER